MICSERERGDQIRGGEANLASEIGPWGPISLANTARGANLASEIGPGGQSRGGPISL